MSYPIHPCDSDGSSSSNDLRSCECETIQVNDQDVIAIKSDPPLDELPSSAEFTVSRMSLTVLTEYCLSEIKRYCNGEIQQIRISWNCLAELPYKAIKTPGKW